MISGYFKCRSIVIGLKFFNRYDFNFNDMELNELAIDYEYYGL